MKTKKNNPDELICKAFDKELRMLNLEMKKTSKKNKRISIEADSLGKLLKLIRIQKGLKVKEVSYFTGVDVIRIYRIEQNVNGFFYDVAKLLLLYRIEIDDIKGFLKPHKFRGKPKEFYNALKDNLEKPEERKGK